ncbi:hypothetical protein M0812_06184 [Anaeramoeba flamelloides]|uniref:ThuA-like domain-containing protein n=1 Tax=Anaeramoeba flamelloides TaxID=1746091 RepID=A0AAV8AB42_9EUKA|nr:hypothetical protein M0812_06184 [Anaeramoeba flamelloides]
MLPFLLKTKNGRKSLNGLTPEKPKPKQKLSDLKILLLTTEQKPLRIDDVITSMKWTGIRKVDIFDLKKKVPSLEQLQQYDSLFIWFVSKYTLENSKKLGDIVAEFVEQGGGIVIVTYKGLVSSKNNIGLSGRIITNDFLPVEPGRLLRAKNDQERIALGEILNHEHPLLENVLAFEGGGCSHRIKTNFKPGGHKSELIAKLNDNNPFISYKQKDKHSGIVVVLNMNPLSGNTVLHGNGKFWLRSTKGFEIIANSLEFVSFK